MITMQLSTHFCSRDTQVHSKQLSRCRWKPQTVTIIFMTNNNQYHPTSGLMQILHFDWLCYYGSISNSHRVAKFASFVNIFILFYSQLNIYIFFSEFIIAFFCPTSWVILKKYQTLRPQGAQINSPFGFALWAIAPQPEKGYGSNC